VRATEGGIGFVKTAGNYAGAMLAGKVGREHGCNVVLWLDAVKRKFIEEFSTMNAFFVINDFVVTPKLGRTILEGITRDSIIRILRDNGYTVFERDISIDEIIQCCEAGMLKEAFGTGTAAVVAPVEAIINEDKEVALPPIDSFKVMNFAAKTLADIRARRIADPYNWLVKVE
jgi:branched-chain amino acid aminotransferase